MQADCTVIALCSSAAMHASCKEAWDVGTCRGTHCMNNVMCTATQLHRVQHLLLHNSLKRSIGCHTLLSLSANLAMW